MASLSRVSGLWPKLSRAAAASAARPASPAASRNMAALSAWQAPSPLGARPSPTQPTGSQLRMQTRGLAGEAPSAPEKRWVSAEGEERKSDSKVVKCNCGRSNKMPFCDNSHRLPWAKLSVSQKIRGTFGGKKGSLYQQAALGAVGVTLAGSILNYKIQMIREGNT